MARYEAGDFVKVKFGDDGSGVGEHMWVRVRSCDEETQVVLGTLDSVPLNDYGGKLRVGTELAVAFAKIVQHRKSWEFDSPN